MRLRRGAAGGWAALRLFRSPWRSVALGRRSVRLGPGRSDKPAGAANDSDVTAAGFVRDGAPVLVRWRAFPMPRSSVIEEEK